MSGSFRKVWRNPCSLASSASEVPGSVIAMKCFPASSSPRASRTRSWK